jgi:hypothetical protein
MKLAQLAATPKLIKLSIDDEDTIKEYGEPIDFYIYDRQKMDVYLQLASLNSSDQTAVLSLVNNLVHNEKGELIITDNVTLPINVMTKVIEKVVQNLGNLTSQTITT